MKLVRNFDRALTTIVTGFLILVFTAMLGLAALQVFLRFFFHTGLAWGDVAARHAVLWVGFFGAYVATREGKHFHIDALTRLFSPAVRRWLRGLTDLFAAIVCAFLFRAATTFVTVAVDPNSILFLGIPEKYVAAIVPIGLALMIVQFLLRIVKNVVGDEA